jgi:methionyl aminopeptidase
MNLKFIKNSIKYFARNKKFIQYREPLIYNEFPTQPARNVPEDIIRPTYVPHAPEKQDFYQNEGHSTVSINQNKDEIENFKKAGKIAAEALRQACIQIKEGSTTEDADRIVHDYIISQNAYPAAINYMGFPKSVCTSVNEIACHGIPNSRKLINGDFVNFDVTAFYGGFIGDTSAMVMIGEVHPDIIKMIEVTRNAMFKAIAICKPGEKIAKIGETIEEYVRSFGYTVCTEFIGHGVGKFMHMQPMVSHVKNSSKYVMEPGMAFTIEPIVMMYPYKEMFMWEDSWSVVCPYNPSAQWEHTILITENGHQILTLRENEDIPNI